MMRTIFRHQAKPSDELAEARAEIAHLRRENNRLVKSESNWMAVCAALAVLVGAIEGRFVPRELWTVRSEERTDVAPDKTLRLMGERYTDARDRARKGG